MHSFIFPDWPSPLAAATEALFQNLPSPKLTTEAVGDPLSRIRTNLLSARETMSELPKLIEPYAFETAAEEMRFFKEVKPLFSATLIYWSRLFHLHLHLPVGGERIIKKYWKSELHSLRRFFEEHVGFYEYWRGKQDYLDHLYFLRNHPDVDESPVSLDLNPRFTTAKDRLVGEILAGDLLEQYLQPLLQQPPMISVDNGSPQQKLRWTASRAGLVELIYALQSGAVYNNGQTGIKEIADSFQQLFEVDLGNYYHVFNEIRLRKKNRTSLLDQLREKVLQKMDAMDEK